MVGDPNDTRRVVITEVPLSGSAADGVAGHGPRERALKHRARGLQLRILLPERPDGDVVYSLATPEDVKALKGTP
jgi:hypothetical protein